MKTYYNIKNNEKSFFDLLYILDKLFKKHNIEYWLCYGSLIGAIREGTYIDWDDDMDIAIYHDDVKRVISLKAEFKKYGVSFTGFVKLGITKQNASMCIFLLYTIKKHGKQYLVQYNYPVYAHIHKIMGVKFNSMLEKSNFYWWLCSKIKRIDTIHSLFDSLGNYAYVPFCDIMAPIPEYPEDYLTFMFNDWRTPHKFLTHKEVNNIYKTKEYI